MQKERLKLPQKSPFIEHQAFGVILATVLLPQQRWFVTQAEESLLANAMHCRQQTTGPNGMRSFYRYLCVLLLSVLETTRETRVTRVEILGNPFLCFPTLVG